MPVATKTKISTKTKIAIVGVGLLALGLAGYGFGFAPGISTDFMQGRSNPAFTALVNECIQNACPMNQYRCAIEQQSTIVPLNCTALLRTCLKQCNIKPQSIIDNAYATSTH